MTFICYSRCTTCRKARAFLDRIEIEYDSRDIKAERPSKSELMEWISGSGLQAKNFFNTSGQLYKSQKLKGKLPNMSEEECLELLSSDGLMVKRPLLIGESFVLVGFNESEWSEKLNISSAQGLD